MSGQLSQSAGLGGGAGGKRTYSSIVQVSHYHFTTHDEVLVHFMQITEGRENQQEREDVELVTFINGISMHTNVKGGGERSSLHQDKSPSSLGLLQHN